MASFDSILLVGCGNMAGAMLDGWLRAGVPADRFTVADPSLREPRAGVKLLPAIPESGAYDVILLGVKPQILADVTPLVAPLAGADTVVLSILAGGELDTLAGYFPDAALVRIMPNLAAALGKSPIALAERGLDDAGRAAVKEFLDPLGTPEWFAESEFDLVTALAGCGPAFVYRFTDALAQAAIALGMDAGQANRLALATVEGASALAAASPHDPAELARRVASPGGATQAGLDAMDQNGDLGTVMLRTLRAARDRSAEMAQDARNKG